MGLKDRLEEIYGSLEEKFYNGIDWLDNKGVSLYPVTEGLEKSGIPAFPVFLTALLLIIIAGGLFFFPLQQTITINIIDSETSSALDNVTIELQYLVNDELETANGETEDGKAVFQISGTASEFNVIAYKEGYKKTEETTTEKNIEIKLEIEPNTITKTIEFLSSNGGNFDKEVSLTFSCSDTDYRITKTIEDGEATLELPKDCGTLLLDAPPTYTTGSFTGIPDSITIEEKDVKTGKLMIKTEPNANLKLYSIDSAEQYLGVTSATGSYLFEPEIGDYYLTVYATGYAFYDSSKTGELFTIEENQLLTETITLDEVDNTTFILTVKDKEDGEFVENADVTIKEGTNQIDEKETDEKGEAVFLLEEGKEYDIEVYKAGYVRYTGTAESEDNTLVYLTPVSNVNSGDLEIEVVDTKDKEIEDALIILKKEGTVIGKPKTTGTNGTAIFRNLDLGTYTITVSKDGLAKKETSFTLDPNNTETKIVLDIAYNTLAVKTTSSGQVVIGATVSAYVNNEKIDSEVTNESGIANLTIRADKEPYYLIEHDDYLTTMTITTDSELYEVELEEGTDNLKVELLGLYKGDELIEAASPGEKYIAKLRVLIPKDESFSETGLFVMTGYSEQNQTNIMEYDSAYISGTNAGYAEINKGTSYSPPKGYSIDNANLTTGKSKFALFKWNTSAKVLEAEIEITAKNGDELLINYRGYGQGESYLRFPYDAILGNSSDSELKQSLYSALKTRSYSLGFENICESGFCRSFYITDLERDLKENVYNEYTVLEDNEYEFNFVLNYRGETGYNSTNLKLDSLYDNIEIESYSIRLPDGVTKEGEGNTTIPITSLTQDSYISGKIVFKAKDPVEDALQLRIEKQGENIFEKSIVIMVEPKEDLEIVILPKEIVPLINNNLIIKTESEGQEVEKAVIEIYKDSEKIYTGITNNSGILKYELQSPALNSEILIKAKKTGFKEDELELKVDKQVLEAVPEKLEETISKEKTAVNTSLGIINNTALDLTITDIKFKGLSSDYFAIDYDSDILGIVLEPTDIEDLILDIRIKSDGLKVEERKEIEGEIVIETRNDSEGYTFTDEIPVEIRIGLGSEVDERDCLQLTPVKWNLTAIPDIEKEITLRIENKCTIDDSPIPLGNIEVRTDLQKEIGTFYIDDKIVSSNYSEILEDLEGDEEIDLVLKFKGNIDTKKDTVLEFRSKNYFSNGTEDIEGTLDIALNIDDLTNCLIIDAPETLEIETMPINLGYSQYASYGYNPYTNMGLPNYSTSSGYSNGVYPNTTNNYSYRSNYYDNSYNNSWKYGLGQQTIQIENKCKQDLQVSINTQGVLTVDKSRLELTQGETESIVVESGYKMGKYDLIIDVITEDNETIEAERISVRVKRADELGENCITLSSKTIALTSVIGAPQKMKVYNNCYDNGFRLENDASNVELSCFIPTTAQQTQTTIKQPQATGQKAQTNQYYMKDSSGNFVPVSQNQTTSYQQQGYSLSGYINSSTNSYSQTNYLEQSDCPLVNYLTVGETNIRALTEKTIETMELRFYPNLTYRKYMCEFSAKNPGEEMFKIRQTLSGAYASINADGTLGVPYYFLSGSSKKVFDITVQDLYQLAGTIDECLENYGYTMSEEEYKESIAIGNPLMHANQCLRTQEIDLTTYPNFANRVKNGTVLLEGSEIVLIEDIKMLKISDDFCGASDKVIPVGFKRTNGEATKEIEINGFIIEVKQSEKYPYAIDIGIKAPDTTNNVNLDLELLLEIQRQHPRNKTNGTVLVKIKGNFTTDTGQFTTEDDILGNAKDYSSYYFDYIDYVFDNKVAEMESDFCEKFFCTEEQLEFYFETINTKLVNWITSLINSNAGKQGLCVDNQTWTKDRIKLCSLKSELMKLNLGEKIKYTAEDFEKSDGTVDAKYTTIDLEKPDLDTDMYLYSKITTAEDIALIKEFFVANKDYFPFNYIEKTVDNKTELYIPLIGLDAILKLNDSKYNDKEILIGNTKIQKFMYLNNAGVKNYRFMIEINNTWFNDNSYFNQTNIDKLTAIYNNTEKYKSNVVYETKDKEETYNLPTKMDYYVDSSEEIFALLEDKTIYKRGDTTIKIADFKNAGFVLEDSSIEEITNTKVLDIKFKEINKHIEEKQTEEEIYDTYLKVLRIKNTTNEAIKIKIVHKETTYPSSEITINPKSEYMITGDNTLNYKETKLINAKETIIKTYNKDEKIIYIKEVEEKQVVENPNLAIYNLEIKEEVSNPLTYITASSKETNVIFRSEKNNNGNIENTYLPEKDFEGSNLIIADKEGIEFNPSYLGRIKIINPNSKDVEIKIFGAGSKEIGTYTIPKVTTKTLYIPFNENALSIKSSTNVDKKLRAESEIIVIYIAKEAIPEKEYPKVEFGTQIEGLVNSVQKLEISKELDSYLDILTTEINKYFVISEIGDKITIDWIATNSSILIPSEGIKINPTPNNQTTTSENITSDNKTETNTPTQTTTSEEDNTETTTSSNNTQTNENTTADNKTETNTPTQTTTSEEEQTTDNSTNTTTTTNDAQTTTSEEKVDYKIHINSDIEGKLIIKNIIENTNTSYNVKKGEQEITLENIKISELRLNIYDKTYDKEYEITKTFENEENLFIRIYDKTMPTQEETTTEKTGYFYIENTTDLKVEFDVYFTSGAEEVMEINPNKEITANNEIEYILISGNNNIEIKYNNAEQKIYLEKTKSINTQEENKIPDNDRIIIYNESGDRVIAKNKTVFLYNTSKKLSELITGNEEDIFPYVDDLEINQIITNTGIFDNKDIFILEKETQEKYIIKKKTFEMEINGQTVKYQKQSDLRNKVLTNQIINRIEDVESNADLLSISKTIMNEIKPRDNRTIYLIFSQYVVDKYFTKFKQTAGNKLKTTNESSYVISKDDFLNTINELEIYKNTSKYNDLKYILNKTNDYHPFLGFIKIVD